MAVSVNRVYQKVLAILNKEQRGYLTPQEFNLFANQAQMDIFEQYFYDINQFSRMHGNDTEYSDMLNILNEKISVFEKEGAVTGGTTLPADLYRLGTIKVSYTDPITSASKIAEAERINKNEYFFNVYFYGKRTKFFIAHMVLIILRCFWLWTDGYNRSSNLLYN